MTGLPPDLTRLVEQERRRFRWVSYLPLWGGAVAVGLVIGTAPTVWPDSPGAISQWIGGSGAAAAKPDGTSVDFGFCHTGGGHNCVVDGDTIWLEGEKIRIADIDAPETHDFRFAAEKDLGDRATRRLEQLLESGTITLQSIGRDADRYGRKLRIVLVNGESVGDPLVVEGLARWYGSGRRPWC